MRSNRAGAAIACHNGRWNRFQMAVGRDVAMQRLTAPLGFGFSTGMPHAALHPSNGSALALPPAHRVGAAGGLGTITIISTTIRRVRLVVFA